MSRIKYVRTDSHQIIVFSELIEHSRFENLNPVSAGFISIGVNKNGNPVCSCYGESVSLGIDSCPRQDNTLAMAQILGYETFMIKDELEADK